VEEVALPLWRASSRFRWSRGAAEGNGTLSEGSAATGAEILVKFGFWEDEEEFFAYRLGLSAFGAIEFAGGEGTEL
jgi:hypothetical protein